MNPRRPTMVFAGLAIIGACTVAACSSAGPSVEGIPDLAPTSVSQPDGGDVSDGTSPPPGNTGTDGVSGDGGGGPDAAVPPAFASDPLNCGALGRSCLGAACSSGLCSAEDVPTAGQFVNDYTFDDDGSLIIVSSAQKGPIHVNEVRRVTAGGGSASLVFTRDGLALNNMFFTQGAMFGEGLGITRYDGSGGSDAVKTILAAKGDKLIFDRPGFYYEDNGDLFRVNAATSAISPLPHITDSGSKLAIVSDATNLYTVNAENTLLRIPKNGTSPHAIVPITGIPSDNVFDLFVTPTTLGGVAVHLGGSCQTTTYTMWSAPIGGGAAKVLSTFTGYISSPVVSGEYVYWGENGCLTSATPDRIMRRRADGSDSPLVVHSAHPLEQVKLFGDYIYWSNGSLHRTPK